MLSSLYIVASHTSHVICLECARHLVNPLAYFIFIGFNNKYKHTQYLICYNNCILINNNNYNSIQFTNTTISVYIIISLLLVV